VNEVTGLRTEIATLSTRLDELEKQKRAEAKRAREEPRHDDEGPGHKQNRAERKWSWKGFSHIGEELFDILADPPTGRVPSAGVSVRGDPRQPFDKERVHEGARLH
jgi:hypothetical protein